MVVSKKERGLQMTNKRSIPTKVGLVLVGAISVFATVSYAAGNYSLDLGGSCFEHTSNGARVGIVSPEKCAISNGAQSHIPSGDEARGENLVMGPGMYCAMDASGAVAKQAKADGASEADIKSRATSSMEPEIGSLFQTQVGDAVYYSIVEGNDGDCLVKVIYKAL
jgi:hypothetical protein